MQTVLATSFGFAYILARDMALWIWGSLII